MPSVRPTAPRGREWVHEIKHDGYRLIVRCEGKRAGVFTRRGFDWTGRFRWIEDALLSLKAQSAVLDGEAVWCGHDGISSFETALAIVQRPSLSIRIRSACTEYRRLSLPTAKERNGKLETLLSHSTGVRFSEHIEGDGAIIFKHACKMGLESIVSKRRDLPYRSGRVKNWIKVKNPASPAMLRIIEEGPW
jgi:bifunctional non-homologous end joining protein LigD